MQRLGTTALVLCTKSTLCPSFFPLQSSPRLLCINQFLIAVTPLLTKADPTFPNCTLDLMSGPVFFLSFLGNPYPLIRRVYFSSYLTGFILSGLDCFLDCTHRQFWYFWKFVKRDTICLMYKSWKLYTQIGRSCGIISGVGISFKIIFGHWCYDVSH